MEDYLSHLPLQNPTQPTPATCNIGRSDRITTVTLSMQAAHANLKPGMVFQNRYEITRQARLRRDGDGLSARDRKLDDTIAIKTIHPEVIQRDPQALERFKQEIKLARRITDRHVLRTFDWRSRHGCSLLP
ncbi:MAG: hypothetical protein R3F37_08970 [Candidatus Competibacteraceae bacterium]